MAARRVAPSAIRIPISAVRLVTTKAITPYRPTTDSNSATAANPPDSVAIMRSVVKERSTCSSSVRGDSRGNVGSTRPTADRIEANAACGVPRTRR